MGVDANLGRASVAIRATLEKLDGDLDQARGKVDSAVSRMVASAGANFQKLGTVALGGISAATMAVVGLGAALAKITIDAAPVEGIAAAFDGLAKSAGVGTDEMLAAMERGSSGMISQRDLMTSFNKAANLVSVDFAQQLPDAMQYLGKVAASTGQDMGFLLDSLVVGVGRVSPMILDNLGIQVSLAEATDRAAQMYGVEAEQLTKAQQQAGMMSVTLEKLAANTASMPDVTETAAAKMAQFKATIQNTKDQIGTEFLPILSTVMGTLGDLAMTILPPMIDGLGNLAAFLEPVIEAFGRFLERIAGGTDPLTSFKVLLLDLLPPDLFFKVLEIVEGIEAFVANVREVLDPIMTWIGENVKLQDVLVVLGAAVLSVILPALGSLIAGIAPVIAVFVLGVAIVAALRAAWESDFLGIRTALESAWAAILPVIETLWAWLQEKVPAAIETLRGFWENTLLPALNTVWAFIETNIIPLMEALGELLTTVVGVAVEALAGIWENVLLPALKTAGTWIKDTLGPILESFREWLDKVTGGAEGISSAFEKVIGWVQNLTEKLKDIKLPDWMTPGSPTPLEIGLLGIGKAMRDVSAMRLPTLSYEFERLYEPALGDGTVGNNGQSQVIIYGLTLEGVQDASGLLSQLQALAV